MNRFAIKKKILLGENKKKFAFYDVELNNLTKKEKDLIISLLELYTSSTACAGPRQFL